METAPGGGTKKSRFEGMTDEQVIAEFKLDEANYAQPNPGGSERQAYADSVEEMQRRGLSTGTK